MWDLQACAALPNRSLANAALMLPPFRRLQASVVVVADDQQMVADMSL